MKIIKLLLLLLVFQTGQVQAQVNINVNVGTAPDWGPAGYSGVKYYYLPDVEAYYDVPSSMFIYNSGGVWIRRSYLPVRYRYYDLYSGYKVVMHDYRGNKPYVYFNSHKLKYAKGYHGKPQRTNRPKPGNSNSKGIKPSGKNLNGSSNKSKNNVQHAGGSGNSKSHGGGKGKH